ncbi:MAG: hypothetical protein HY754_01565 [Nitrospirae bacterium]|nr:hypothetical protein [Nitrospirota bacterium]
MKNILDRLRAGLKNEFIFGILVISGIMVLYYPVFPRLFFSRQYAFGGDSYFYWSFKYMILYSIKYFNSLPWWDPTSWGGYPLYYHFLSGWSNYLGPYYLPSLILFKIISLFTDISINGYIIFHQTIYIVLLNMIAVYLISRELVTNRIAAILPVFIFAFSYFQLMNFHDFYAFEAMVAPLFYIFALIRLNNRRTKGSLILFLLFLGLYLASLQNGILMSAFYWSVIFTFLLLIFNVSLIKDAYRIFMEMIRPFRGKIIAVLLVLLIISGFVASWLPFHYNAGHVIKYRGGEGNKPLAYDATGLVTDYYLPIVSSEVWSVFLNWTPFSEIHDAFMRFTWDGHQNRYIGLATLPLIITALTLCLKNRYVYILFLTYFFCNAVIIYATDNIVYKILTDNSDIFRNVANMSTIFPRGGPPLFLIFLSVIGLDKLLKISAHNELSIHERSIRFENLFKGFLTVLLLAGCILIVANILSALSPMLFWVRHSLGHIGIYLLIFTFLCRILFISNDKVIRRAVISCLFIFTFTDLTVAASSYILKQPDQVPEEKGRYVGVHIAFPYEDVAARGMTIPDNVVFKPITSEAESMFPKDYFGIYHNSNRISWTIKEWMFLASREDGRRFLLNWNPQAIRMTKYPDFRFFRNGYYLPFERIKELDGDRSIYYADPLFYLHDEQPVRSKNADPREQVFGSYELKEYTFNKVVMQGSTDKSGFLYFLDNYDRFWSAYVDGKRVKVHRANFTHKAIELPAGTHNIVWVYNPYPVKSAYLGFYLILIILFVVLLYSGSQGRKKIETIPDASSAE